jgi:murein DD-endopeptidase MepM/ murein hydrolase activator NlpD
MATAAEAVFAPAGYTPPAARRLPALAKLPRPGKLLARAPALADIDLLVDLGADIGSARWWRGVATVALLSGAAIAVGLRVPVLDAPAPPARSPAQAEEARHEGIGPLAMGSVTGRTMPQNSLARRLAEAPERPRIELSASVGAGGLEAALRRAGVGREDLDALARLFAGQVSSSSLKPGTSLDLVLGRRDSKAVPRPLESLDFRAAFDLRMSVSRNAAGELVARAIPIRIDNTPLRVTGVVGSSLERAARAAGLPENVIRDYVRQMSYVIDFQREVGRRDRFEMVVARRRAETGETELGGLLFAGLVNGRANVSLMRWGPNGEFFWQNGEGARKGLMRTPVNGARQSSGFGMRFHPILGYSRMHQGTDFAAPAGAPILASAAGTVAQAGWGGGYGNVVVVDHGKGLKTRYAHMSRVGVRVGQKVGQGQVIGAVGSTGLSTGPHLHYEVWMNNSPVDPRSAKFQAGSQLGGQDLARFKAEMARLKALPAAGSAG